LPCTEKKIRDLKFFGYVCPENREKLREIGTKKLLAGKRKALAWERK